ncbi:MAG TPA: Abi-alpha family protein [Solirubrobacteraceae bacterium]|nr:Abi-alpha family protein [Solirubrobacteraceae bacterium]
MSVPEPPSDNGRAPDSLADALPGLFRVAAGVWIRTGVWAFETSLRVGARLARASTSPEAAAELVEEVGSGIRNYARELLGVADLDDRVRQLMPPRPRPESRGPRGTLREQGAELLRLSADVDAEDGAHPAYARILTELAPDEARILRLLMNHGPQPSVDVFAANLIGMGTQLVARDLTMVGTEAGVRHPDKVPAYLNNLRRLGLIAITDESLPDPIRYQVVEAQPDAIAAMKRAGRVKTVHRTIEMTPFGTDFCNTALPLEEERATDLT